MTNKARLVPVAVQLEEEVVEEATLPVPVQVVALLELDRELELEVE